MVKNYTNIDEKRIDIILLLSHELRSYLNTVLISSKFLLDFFKDEGSIYVSKYVKKIYDESEKMEILLENFLNDTTNENGLNSLNLKKENITNIIENCIKNSKDLAKKRNLSLSINIPRYLIFKVDKVKFEVIIRNLLSNAIKNTPPNGKICIETQKYENYFDIIISDNGIGFTENEKKNIFKKFGKIKRDNKNFDIDTGGYGLGLYISKKIVQLHGGKIWVESKGRNKGSSFIIRIPTNHSS